MPPTLHRSSRATPMLLAALALVFLLMAIGTLVRALSSGASGIGTAILGILIAAAVGTLAFRSLVQVRIDDDGIEEWTPRGTRRLRWDEITRVTAERRTGSNVMRLHRDDETWVVNFLAFPKPERVVGFVTERLPKTVKPQPHGTGSPA